MRWNGFFPGLVSAAAAVCWVPFSLLAAPAIGGANALAGYLAAVVMVYLGGIAPTLRRGVRVAVLAGVLAAAALVVAPSLSAVLVALAVILAVGRSAILFRSEPARALVLEAGLVGLGLVAATALSTPRPLGVALGIWTFFLIQSAYFLIGGVRRRPAPAPPGDPFLNAHARALRLMDDQT